MVQSDRSHHRFASSQLRFSKDTHNATDGVVITIDRSKRLQSLIGFGGAITDSSAINILKLAPKLATNVVKDYFGRNGLRYTMARVPIGGSDFSTRAYTYDDTDHEDFDLVHFKLAHEDVQYKVWYKTANF